jgi:hypothetical protein
VTSPTCEDGPTPWLVPGPKHHLSLKKYLDEHDSLKNVGLIQMWRLGSMGPLVRPLKRHNRHSEAILGIPEQRRCITWHECGSFAPRGPATPIHPRARQNRPTTASGAVIRGVQGERWWIIGSAAPPDLAAPDILSPRAPQTLVAYKRHLTLAGLDTQCRSISISLFCSLRVRLV